MVLDPAPARPIGKFEPYLPASPGLYLAPGALLALTLAAYKYSPPARHLIQDAGTAVKNMIKQTSNKAYAAATDCCQNLGRAVNQYRREGRERGAGDPYELERLQARSRSASPTPGEPPQIGGPSSRTEHQLPWGGQMATSLGSLSPPQRSPRTSTQVESPKETSRPKGPSKGPTRI